MDGEYRIMELDEAMNIAGYGKYNIGMLFLCGMSLLGMMFDTVGSGFIMPAAQCDLKLSITDKGWLGAVPFIAIILSSHMWGWFADTKGRKTTLMYSSLIGGILTVLTSFSPTLITFGIMKFIAGFFNSSLGAVALAYLAECNPRKHQDKMVILGSSFVPLATVLMPMIGWLIIPIEMSWPIDSLGIEYRSWRLFVVIISLPIFIVCISLWCGVPESPKLLYSIGKYDEAMAVIRTIDRINHKTDALTRNIQLKRIKYTDGERHKTSVLQSVKAHTFPLFVKPYCAWTLIAFVAQFTHFACSNGFYIWYPQIFNRMSSSTGNVTLDGKTICEIYSTPINHTLNNPNISMFDMENCNDSVDVFTYQRSIVLGLFFLPPAYVAAFFINSIGNKRMLIGMCSIAGVAGALAGVIPNHYAVLVFLGLFQMSSTCITLLNVLVLKLYPTNLRAMAVSLTMMMGRFGSIFGSNVVGIMMESTCIGTFVLFGGLLIGSAVLCLLLPSKVSPKLYSKVPQKENENLVEMQLTNLDQTEKSNKR